MGQTLRRFGGRQPLCGIGVTSLMPTTSIPVFWMVRMAVSRPEPGPFTTTSTLRTPCSMARRAAVSAASCAAKGVLLREPLNPTLPAEAHAIVFPDWSVNVMMVLLNDDLMCAVPYAMFLRSRRLGRRPPAAGFAMLDIPLFLLLRSASELLPRLLAAGDGLLRTLARPRVGARALATDGETPAVAQALVAADLDLALDV